MGISQSDMQRQGNALNVCRKEAEGLILNCKLSQKRKQKNFKNADAIIIDITTSGKIQLGAYFTKAKFTQK
jgi:hypothetical protein